ncbi:MAG: site-specific DNA-methyltransferase [Saprospiraceae bacterium]|nr:site-specific DNA-methyltransferase [Saprospiraceae bacterium]
MNIGFNKVHHTDFLSNDLPDKCANLIIADPPYFQIKGAFDFVWEDFNAYLKDVRKWAQECKRLLADNGSLFWYGHAKNIAYSQVILDEFFNLENVLVWEKNECHTKAQDFSACRCFAPVTERILFYSNFSQAENDWKNNNATVYYEGFEPTRLYIEQQIKKIKVKKAAAHLGISERAIRHWTSKSQWHIPSDENVKRLQQLGIFKEFEKVRKEFEKVRKEFEASYRRWFYNYNKFTDVLKFSQESHITKQYDHDTKKPETLTRALIQTCSRPNDLVLIPFAGSGTECAMAAKEGRRFVGFDIEQKYVDMSNKRCKVHFDSPSLFSVA